MDVKKIFIILITVVACVIIGAFFLNTLMPNAVNGVVNAVEDSIYSATHLSIDLNGDKSTPTALKKDAVYGGQDDEQTAVTGAGVEGWE